ncbi:MAG: sodium:proton antiporter, partial [Verrucomicrobiota bacterium]
MNFLLQPLATVHAEAHPLMLIPFGLLLLAIAIAPLTLQHAWEKFYHWVAAGLGSITLLYYLFILREPE